MSFAVFIRTAVFNDALPGLSVRQDNVSGVVYEALGPDTVPYYVGSRVGEAENVYEVVPITDGVEIRLGPGGGTAPDVILRRNTANTLTLIGTFAGAGIIARSNAFDDATVGFSVRQDGAEAAIEALRDASNLGEPFFRAKFTGFANDLWRVNLAADGTEMYFGLGSAVPDLVMKAFAAVGVFSTAATFESISPAANQVFFTGRLSTDTQQRFQVDSSGGLSLGPGGVTVPDVHLIRVAAGVFGIQDNSQDLDRLQINGLEFRPGVSAGTASFDVELSLRGLRIRNLVPGGGISQFSAAQFNFNNTDENGITFVWFSSTSDGVTVTPDIVRSSAQIDQTSVATASTLATFHGQINVVSANTQNWTATPVAFSAFRADLRHNGTAGGLVTGMAGFHFLPAAILGASIRVTNLYGVYIADPTATSGLTNLYGIFIEDLIQGAVLNIGLQWTNHLIYSAGAFTFQENTIISSTGTLTLAGSIITGSLNPLVDDTNNTGITQVLALTHTTSDAPGVGIGVGMEFIAETAAGNNEIGAIIEAVTTNVGAGTEVFDLVFRTMAGGAAAASRMTLNDAGLTFAAAAIIEATGNLTLRATAGNDVLIGDDVVLFRVDGGTETIAIGPSITANVNRLINVGGRRTAPTADVFGLLMSLQVDVTVNNAFVISALSGIAEVRTENTADWTAAVGMRGIDTRPMTTSGTPAGTVAGAAGIYIADSQILGTLILTTQYGIYIENLTAGGTDIGIYIVGAADLAIWVDAGNVRFDSGLVVNEDAVSSGDFRVESENNTQMLFVDSNIDAIAIGRAPIAGTTLIIGGTTSGGAGGTRGLYLAVTLAPDPDINASILRVQPIITEAASGTHALLTGIQIDSSTVNVAGAAVTNTAMFYIDAAMVATVTGANYSIWVDAGPTRLDGPLIIDGAFTIQANSATEIGFAVVSSALAIGSLGSIVVPLKTDTGAPNDAAFGDLNGAFGFNSFDNTLEVRDGVDTFLSVGVAGIVIQRRAPVIASLDGWYHPQQYLDATLGYVDETRCIECGGEMQPGDRIGLYANGRIRNDDLHAIFGHDHLETNPVILELQEEIKKLRAQVIR